MSNKFHHISEVPTGYLLRINHAKRVHQIHFSKKAKLSTIIEIRDNLLGNLRETPSPKNQPICHQKCRSNTGYMGISLTTHKGGYERLVASVRPQRCKGITKSFYLNNYNSYEEALQEAVAWREEILEHRRTREKKVPPEENPRFLKQIAQARQSIKSGKGIPA